MQHVATYAVRQPCGKDLGFTLGEIKELLSLRAKPRSRSADVRRRAKAKIEDIDSKKTQLRIMRDLVEEGLSILTSDRDIADFGELLHETWQLKRSLSDKTTNPEVDRIYEHARSTGALGGKLTGAGGGGFMLLFAPPERHARIKKELQKLIYVPFKIEFAGSQIIFLDHEEDYSAEEAAQAKEQHREFRELAEIEGGDS